MGKVLMKGIKCHGGAWIEELLISNHLMVRVWRVVCLGLWGWMVVVGGLISSLIMDQHYSYLS